jgi:hypothetical protein
VAGITRRLTLAAKTTGGAESGEVNDRDFTVNVEAGTVFTGVSNRL